MTTIVINKTVSDDSLLSVYIGFDDMKVDYLFECKESARESYIKDLSNIVSYPRYPANSFFKKNGMSMPSINLEKDEHLVIEKLLMVCRALEFSAIAKTIPNKHFSASYYDCEEGVFATSGSTYDFIQYI